ncbi:MAG: tRNA (adenosine(37)-N6)-threonylcarbamoyltransferase complex ATPase subunit type 1 TsaE [Limnochordia bacterium]|jgi:tRNA threonylcarbamoyladenosine biosynthesis protein TsaE|nr:tRNA (adenosine(37)-N6)-threonylcarbamoyltransferase complex ATPase subunit type 1 TsaE [Limnochordia bacterium]MDD4518213.1 tRNA (adenosine(37)-N6)-threonylcarbamoyltransferase complex ATPase subunit type 1 TsaE [Limnochordia bacterium]
MEFLVTTNSNLDTKGYGQRLASYLLPGDVIALSGDLGAGKTTFCQGIGQGLGVGIPIKSPTFTIIREYEGRIPFYHFDVYRLNSLLELEDLGYEEYFYGDGVVAIEWADLIKPVLPEDHLEVIMEYGHESGRKIWFVAHGPRTEEILKMYRGLER